MTKRTTCTICGNDTLHHFLTTKPIPVFQGCTRQSFDDDISEPQLWGSCSECGTIQLINLMPDELVYGGGHATSSGKVWDDHHNQLALFINEHCDHRPILEIGGGVGKLAESFRKNAINYWRNVEPSSLAVPNIEGYEAIRALFNEEFTVPENTGTVVFSHSLEHMYNVKEILAALQSKLSKGTRLIVAWPEIEEWLPKSSPGALNWEHTFFCPIDTLRDVLASYGFMFLEEQKYLEDHSRFMVFELRNPIDVKFRNTQKQNEQLVIDYFRGFELKVEQIINEVKQQPVFLMPASVYAQFLLCYGLDQLNIKWIIDDAPIKLDKRLYGTKCWVVKRDNLPNEGTLILNAGAHSQNIIKELSQSHPNLAIVNVGDLK